MHPYDAENYARWHLADLLREAESQRLASRARPRRARAANRLILTLGNTLVRLGTRLQTRATGACPAGPRT